MKKLFNFNKLGALIVTFIITSTSFSQELNSAAQEVIEQNRTMYEYFGMTSTQLFILMISITILLVIILVSLSLNTAHILDYIQKKSNGGNIKLLAIGFIMTSSSPSFAASETVTSTSVIPFSDFSFWVLVIFDLFLLSLILYFTSYINSILSEFTPQRKRKVWSYWKKKFANITPIEDEQSVLMDHDYDGIKELDNDLPPWWKYGFYITVVWAVIYFGYYQFVAETQAQEFETAMTLADLEVERYKAAHPELINIGNVVLLEDDNSLKKGSAIYRDKCVICHQEGGIGGIGPNLTDENWIYNGDIAGVFESIAEGRTNGMVAWKEFLNPIEIQTVASYVLKFKYVGLPIGKLPEGNNTYPKIN